MEVNNETQYILEEFYGTSFDINSSDEIGKLLKGKYRILEVVSSSSKSKVFKVEADNNIYIAKFMLDKEHYKYLEAEAKLLSDLNHKGIIKYINFYTETKIDPPLLITEYVESQSIDSFDNKIEVLLKMLEPLIYLEEKGSFHGDIKVENYLFNENQCRLIDFGIANVKDRCIGTIKYLAPEVLQGEEKGIQSDIYSFGLMAYEYIYSYPFTSSNIQKEIIEEAITFSYDNLILDLILAKAVNKDLNFRYKSFAELFLDLSLLLEGNQEKISKSNFASIYIDYRATLEVEAREIESLDHIVELLKTYLYSSSFRLDKFDNFYASISKVYRNIDKAELLEMLKVLIKKELKEPDFSKLQILEKNMDYSRLITKLKNYVSKGSIEAEYRLALYYKNGKVIDKDIEKHYKHLKSLDSIDYPKAAYQLGLYYQSNEGLNMKLAKTAFEKGARLGHFGSMNNLAISYRFGYGVEKDLEEAFHWYKKAAEGGHIAAQNNLGFMYKNAYGTLRDFNKAFYWYKKSAEAGNKSAQVNLAYMYREGLGQEINFNKAFYWYKKSAEAGNLSAQINIGKFYQEGWSVDIDYRLAYKYYSLGVEANNELAITYMAYLYEMGLGVEKDLHKAKDLYERALKKGFSLAQYHYGRMLIESNERDFDKGIKYLKKASKQKNIEGQLYLAKCYIDGLGVEKSFVKGKKWYEIAIEEGSSEALYQLGLLYFQGKEVLQNYTKAFDYMLRSGRMGNKGAQINLANMYQHGYGVKRDEAEALMWRNLSGQVDEEVVEEQVVEKEEINQGMESSIVEEKVVEEKVKKRNSFIKNIFGK